MKAIRLHLIALPGQGLRTRGNSSSALERGIRPTNCFCAFAKASLRSRRCPRVNVKGTSINRGVVSNRVNTRSELRHFSAHLSLETQFIEVPLTLAAVIRTSVVRNGGAAWHTSASARLRSDRRLKGCRVSPLDVPAAKRDSPISAAQRQTESGQPRLCFAAVGV
jgi:hypothetical protein